MSQGMARSKKNQTRVESHMQKNGAGSKNYISLGYKLRDPLSYPSPPKTYSRDQIENMTGLIITYN